MGSRQEAWESTDDDEEKEDRIANYGSSRARDRWRDFGLKQDSKQWQDYHDLTKRPFLITASTVASVAGFGYDSCKRVQEMYYVKHWKFSSPAMAWGKEREPEALAAFQKLTAPDLHTVPVGMVRHFKYDWLAASLDGVAVTDKKIINVEFKCPWRAKMPRHVDEVRLTYVIQCQIQMLCFGPQETILFYYHPELGTAGFHLEADEEIQTLLVELCIKFREAVEAGAPFQDASLWKQKLKPLLVDYLDSDRIQALPSLSS